MPTVLVADDDDNIRLLVGEVVRSVGYDVIFASDGIQAQRMSAEVAFDIAILDISMPGHTGLEVCATLKSSNQTELVPVILLTARDSLDDKVNGLDAGADEYLTKPFQAKELAARLKACWRMRELNLKLSEQTQETKRLQHQLLEKERKTAVGELGGALAHELGQPVSAILLNLYLVEALPKEDARFFEALEAIKRDSSRLTDLIEKIKTIDSAVKEQYHQGTEILKLPKKD